MTEQTTNKGITHVWPYNTLVNPDAQPFSSERELDVWDELRGLTFDENARGHIFVALHSSDDHDLDKTAFTEELERDTVANNRVQFYTPREVELNIHHPATASYSYKRTRTLAEAYTKGPNGWEELPDPSNPIEMPATLSRNENEKRLIPFNLGSKQDAELVIKQYRNHELCAFVLWHPDESEHLKYLPKVKAACPDLPIYIFHCSSLADKWGVEREDNTFGSLWDTHSDMVNEKELQAVIEHIANVWENTWIESVAYWRTSVRCGTFASTMQIETGNLPVS